MRARILAAVFLLLLARPARADDDGPTYEHREETSEPALNLASQRGLTGMREMIDARTPAGDVHLRVGASIQASSETIEQNGDVRSMTLERYELTPYAGASFLGHLELGFHWSFPEIEHTVDSVHGIGVPVPDPWPSLHKDELVGGGGNPSFSAKAGWTLGPVSLAAYVTGQPDVGSRLMAHKTDSFGEAALAATIAVAKIFSIHLNLGGRYEETSRLPWEVRYRTGFGAVVLENDRYVARMFLYGDGLAREGGIGSDYRLGGGVQLQVGEHFQAEITGDGRLYAGQLVGPFHDDGTFSIGAGAGFLY
jgi:hypothetical protein